LRYVEHIKEKGPPGGRIFLDKVKAYDAGVT